MLIRPLTAADAGGYLALRREMLLDAPWAFAASPQDDRFQREQDVLDHLADPSRTIIGAFESAPNPNSTPPAPLIGAAGLAMNHRAKMAHRAQVWGVYVVPSARDRGVGRALFTHLMRLASTWPGVTSLGLSASRNSPAAVALYTRVGFVAWGVEPGAMVIDGRTYDEVHMIATLGGPGT